MKMEGKIVGPIQLSLGFKDFQEMIYSAPIIDEMLLGMDLMKKYGFSLTFLHLSYVFSRNGPRKAQTPQTKARLRRVMVYQ